MRKQRSETRRTRLARVGISWSSPDGKISNENVMLEDVTRSGAGFRVRFALPVGLPLLLESGEHIYPATVRHCHRDGIEFFVGVAFLSPVEDLSVGRVHHSTSAPVFHH